MAMQSWAFILFALISVLLYWLVIPRRFRPHFLLLISVGYYFACSVVFGVFLLIYLYGMFVVGILIDTANKPRGRKIWMIVGIVAAIGLLFVFKARIGIIQLVFMLTGMGTGKMAAALAAQIGIPLGISYFTFRVVHYLVEVYRGKVVRATPLEFFLYVTFFPAMVSGPIHRFSTLGREDPRDSFADQLRQEGGSPAFAGDDFGYGLWRILTGVVKKFVLADFFLALAGPMMTQAGLSPAVSTGQLWMAGHAWFAYLYLDFSGYTDMAIGIARLFGFRIMENFNWPIF
ncbi:MAG: MBOAT family O-acyltransferase, partial [Alphaproteobacteria bacterium]